MSSILTAAAAWAGTPTHRFAVSSSLSGTGALTPASARAVTSTLCGLLVGAVPPSLHLLAELARPAVVGVTSYSLPRYFIPDDWLAHLVNIGDDDFVELVGRTVYLRDVYEEVFDSVD
jgi:hypothetical protein